MPQGHLYNMATRHGNGFAFSIIMLSWMLLCHKGISTILLLGDGTTIRENARTPLRSMSTRHLWTLRRVLLRSFLAVSLYMPTLASDGIRDTLELCRFRLCRQSCHRTSYMHKGAWLREAVSLRFILILLLYGTRPSHVSLCFMADNEWSVVCQPSLQFCYSQIKLH